MKNCDFIYSCALENDSRDTGSVGRYDRHSKVQRLLAVLSQGELGCFASL